MALGQSCRYQ
jgi:hypothetical protein